MRTVTSRHNAAVRLFRELADRAESADARVLLDGAHLVRDARAAKAAFEIAAVAASRLTDDTEERRLADELEREGVDVIAAADQVFGAMSPVRTPSGIIAIVRQAPSDAREICARPDGFMLTLVDVQDPGNIGALVRVAEAGGVTGVLVCRTPGGASAHPFGWKALRGSMGSALRLPIASGLDAAAALDGMRAAGTRLVAAVPRGGLDPDAVTWSGRVGLVLGGEGPGLPDGLTGRCDERVTIPMAPGVESLNVGAAGAILIYAARRQRSALTHRDAAGPGR